MCDGADDVAKSVSALRTRPRPTLAHSKQCIATCRTAMQGAKVGIIGAGPGGLLSAKVARECGLVPTVYEGAKSAGGVWRKPPSIPWDGMRTNMSYETMAFSDFPWPDDTPHYPNRREVCKYLQDYIHAFDLEECIRFQDEVESVERTEGGWRITAKASGGELYDYVTVAAGLNKVPIFPDIPGLKDDFSGRVIHAAAYQNPEPFRDQTVMVIGNAFTGADMCSDLVRGGAKRVVNVVRRPLWFLKRYTPSGIPSDWMFSRRIGSFFESGDETVAQCHMVCAQLTKNAGDVCEELRVDPEKHLPYVTVTDNYLDDVEKGDIEVRKGLARLEGNEAVFENGERIHVESVVCATGYKASLPFFDQSMLKECGADFSDAYQPLILYKSTFPPPALPNLAFVGEYRGTTFNTMELQARWVSMVFSGELPCPTEAEIDEGLQEELKYRKTWHKTQVKYTHKFDDELARTIGVFPEADMNGDMNGLGDAELAKWLADGPILSAHYRLCGPYAKRKAAIEHIKKVNEKVERIKGLSAEQ